MKVRMYAKLPRSSSRASGARRHFSPGEVPELRQNERQYGPSRGFGQVSSHGYSLNSIPILASDKALPLPLIAEETIPQGFSIAGTPVQKNTFQQKSMQPASHKRNSSGLPDRLKRGFENLSGLSLDDVQVHYNSSKPAQMNALAYTQGRDIYMGPGQEKHLAHEAWHAVQQKQGLVGRTALMKGLAMNNDPALEREADVMGERASQFSNTGEIRTTDFFQQREQRPGISSIPLFSASESSPVVQRLPKLKFIDLAEEAQVEADIKGKKFQDALDHLMATSYFTKAKSTNVRSVTFEPRTDFKDYGIAEQDKDDPATHNEVDIRIGTAAYKDISILASTLQHELIHAEQYTKHSDKGEDIKGSWHMYGYANEGNSPASRYIAAAQEIETHCWEIENANLTSVPREFLEDRGTALLNYWAILDDKVKEPSKVYSRKTRGRSRKISKPKAYHDALKARVENAFDLLKKAGIDTGQYFKYGKHGLKIK